MYQCFAVCPRGLEAPLAEELTALSLRHTGLRDVTVASAGVHFKADWRGVLLSNLTSRISSRILLQVAHHAYYDTDDLYELSYSVPWHDWFDGPTTRLRLDISSHRSPLTSLRHALLRCKDAVCDRFVAQGLSRPDIDTQQPTVRLHVFLNERDATLYIDTSGESLFKRGWRLAKQQAPLKENLAAGILQLAGWRPGLPLLDPFCGSGTISIEAALWSLNVPPGLARRFAFEHLHIHTSKVWREVRNAACAAIGTADTSLAPIIASDIDPQAIADAVQNLENARQQMATNGALSASTLSIEWRVADVRHMQIAQEQHSGVIVTNPPYGQRLQTDEDPYVLYREWSSVLKQQFGGWGLGVLSADPDFPKQLRLQPKRKIPLFNGDTECRLFNFELVSGGYRS